MTFLLFGCTAAALPSRRAEAALLSTDAAASQSTPLSILQVGDSFMEYSVQLLGDYCTGASVVNRGVHASFAVEWVGGSQSCPSLEGGQKSCNFDDALVIGAPSATYGPKYTHAILSVGANEFLGTGHTLQVKASEVASRVDRAIKALQRAAAAANNTYLKIIMPAYPMTAGPTSRCPTPGCIAEELNGALAAAAANNTGVEYVDATMFAAGGSMASFAPREAHKDTIHPNPKGYCLLWTTPQMQQALGCGQPPKPYDCSNVS